MSVTAIVLITLSAFAHALWNLIGKRQNPSAAFFLIASTCAALATLPLVIHFKYMLSLVPGSVWLLLCLTGICQSVYYIGLAAAYRSGDVSVVYPLVRALPVVLVALVSTILGIGKPLNLQGVGGILAIVAGCLVIPLRTLRGSSYWKMHRRDFLTTSYLLVFVAALGTCGYTLIDNEALRQLRSLPGIGMDNTEITLIFLALENITTALALAGYVLISVKERRGMKMVWKSGWLIAGMTGLLITGTYGLVLVAMAYVTNVSYLAAFRQMSIPLGALMGILIQREPANLPKVLGIAVVCTGLILVGFA